MKKIFILFAAALTIGLTGCQSFLEEETYGSTTEIFKEENGIKALVYQSYTKINNLYGGDGQWPLMTELGTDIYLRGKNQGDVGLCDYYGLDATNGNVAWLWNHCYKALFNINLFFETIDQTPFADEDEKSQFKAEMYVMRALFLWIVTETWGDSYLPMTTDETEGTEARRSPRAKFYEEIIGALEAAIGLFPDTRTTESGRIDMPAAKALLARMYLYNEQWDEAADMASQVIGHYGLELCPSLKDLWADDKTNNEFIWTTEFTEDDAFRQANGYWSWYAMYIDRFRACRPCSNGRATAAARRSPRPTSWICSTATPTNAGATCTNGYGITTTRPTTVRHSRSTSGANTSTRHSTSVPTYCPSRNTSAWKRPSRYSTATTCSTPTASRRIAGRSSA